MLKSAYTRYLESLLETERKSHADEIQRLRSDILTLKHEAKEFREWIKTLEGRLEVAHQEHEWRAAFPGQATPRERAELVEAANSRARGVAQPVTLASVRKQREAELRKTAKEAGGPIIKNSLDIKREMEEKMRAEAEVAKNGGMKH